MSNPTIFSGSSLNIFIECPKQWEYAYIWRVRRPPSFKMALGSAAHAAVEFGMKTRIEEGAYPPVYKWTTEFDRAFKNEASLTLPRNSKPEESYETHRESGVSCVEFYAKEIAPPIVPLAVEKQIQFSINRHIWTGLIDLLEAIDGNPKRIRVRDHKFTSKRPDNPARYRWPMIGYALGIRVDMGITEEDVQLDYIIRNKKPIHFPVNTGGPITEEDTLDFAQEIEVAANMVDHGSFPSLGTSNGSCAWCPYWYICPNYRGNKKKPGHGARPD